MTKVLCGLLYIGLFLQAVLGLLELRASLMERVWETEKVQKFLQKFSLTLEQFDGPEIGINPQPNFNSYRWTREDGDRAWSVVKFARYDSICLNYYSPPGKHYRDICHNKERAVPTITDCWVALSGSRYVEDHCEPVSLASLASIGADRRDGSRSGKGRVYSLTGKGWVILRRVAESPDLPFIRDYVEKMEFYEEAKQVDNWEITDLRVGYHDLNDDGVPEMLLWLSVSGFFCSDNYSACDLYIFERRNGRWQEIVKTQQNGVWVSDETVQGWRTLYSNSGRFLRWQDERGYGSFCTESLPDEIYSFRKISCPTG